MRLRERLWNPYAVVFFSSACIMIIELVASRIIAPNLGVSLYTWTTVIGVILAGISLGNYIGGRLADRFASPPFLGFILALASFGSLSILWLNRQISELTMPENMPMLLGVILYIAGIFFLPSMILGCVSPIVVKLSLTDLKRTGTTVGKIYAWSSVGSIAGTFATGFFLISWFGTRTILLGVSALLILMALWFLTDTRPRRALVTAGFTLLIFLLIVVILTRRHYLDSACLRETNYFCINVRDKQVGDSNVRVLVLDRLVHSYSDIDNPANLVYGYEQAYAEVIRPLTERKPNLNVFFIGGGGYTFPRYLEATLPGSHSVVAEIDPEVTEVAYERMGLRPSTRIETHAMDARLFMMREGRPASFDLIFGDAFNDYSVPFHLTTLEFNQLVKRLLREDGLYVVNIIDSGKRGHFLRAYVRTLQQVFPYVEVIPQDPDWRDSIRMTFVVVAANHPIDLSGLTPQLRRPLSPEELQELLAQEPPIILRDDYVPVDNLLAGVFADSGWK